MRYDDGNDRPAARMAPTTTTTTKGVRSGARQRFGSQLSCPSSPLVLLCAHSPRGSFRHSPHVPVHFAPSSIVRESTRAPSLALGDTHSPSSPLWPELGAAASTPRRCKWWRCLFKTTDFEGYWLFFHLRKYNVEADAVVQK